MEKFRTIQNLKHLCKDRRQHGRQTIRVDGNGSFKENCGVYAVRLFLRMDTWMTLLIAFKPTRKPKLLQRKSTKHWKSVAFGSKNGLYQDHPSWRSSRVPSKARKEIMRNLKGGLEIPLSRQEIAWDSCSRQVYPITLDARLLYHAITQLFSSHSRFHALKYVQPRHHAFPAGVGHI